MGGSEIEKHTKFNLSNVLLHAELFPIQTIGECPGLVFVFNYG